MADNDDKKTKTKTVNPYDWIDDTAWTPPDAGRQAPAKVVEPTSTPKTDAPKADLNRANPERTRSVRVEPNDQMRGYLDRLNQVDIEPEADLEPQMANAPAGEPEGQPEVPVEPNTLPDILHREVTVPGTEIEWHQVRDLPGFQSGMVRAIGREQMAKFTNTPLDQITAIAHVTPPGNNPMIGNRGGPGGFDPRGAGAGNENFNTMAELQAVANWLHQNAEHIGNPDVAPHRAIPGYRSEVREYVAMGIRFHVVRDFIDNNLMGYYIYAWPEQDSKNPGQVSRDNGRPQIGGDRPRLTRRESTEMEMKSSSYLAEAFKGFKKEYVTEQKWLVVERKAYDTWNQTIIESILDESTISRIVGKVPGGQQVVRWMHARHKLSNEANWEEHPMDIRVANKEFKNHPDKFMFIVGTEGVAAVKPSRAFIEKKLKDDPRYNPATDTTLPYQIIAFRGNEMLDPEIFRDPENIGDRDPRDPTVVRARIGLPGKKDIRQPNNIFDKLREQIGALQKVVIARGGVEREKIAGRAAAKAANELPSSEQMKKMVSAKVTPILRKLVVQAQSIVHNRIQRAINAQNFEMAQKLARTGEHIKNIGLGLEQGGTVDINREPYKSLFDYAFRELGASSEERDAILANIIGKGDTSSGFLARNLGGFLDALRNTLVREPRAYGGYNQE